MKRLCVLFFILSVFINANDNRYGSGQVFVGPHIGFSGYSLLSAGVMAGYQYYFANDWQFSGFRQGVRGYANISYAAGSFSVPLYVYGGADWTLDFNIKDDLIWGVFAGLGVGYNGPSPALPLGILAHIGGSLNIQNHHRFDLALGGLFNIISLNYLYMF